jgi:glucose-1-phosphate thymidylyltransferase
MMKAVILSGGKGTRLRPITHTNAKQLVPVANKPILFYGIEEIVRAGIRDVGIVIGDTGNEIKKAVGDGKKWGIKVTYIQQESPLGLAHAVKICKEFTKRDSFVVFLGDNLIRGGIKDLVDDFRKKKPNAQVLLAHVPHPEQFGVVELKGNEVCRLVEKPAKPKSDLALVGVYMFDDNVYKAISNIKPSARGELEITDAIQWLVDNKYKVTPYIIKGWWKDTGKIEDMLEANRIILDDIKSANKGKVDGKSEIKGKVIIESGARVIDSVIRGPVIIGENAVIKHSYIGPFTSIASGVVIESSEVEHSIILAGCRIIEIKRIEDSLMGQNVHILKSKSKPTAYRIMVGDSSRIEVL